MACCLCYCNESLLGLLEVDYIPNRSEVIGFYIFVLKVEGVFPDIDTDDGLMSEKRILVGGSHDFQLFVGRAVTEPAPATALDGGSCSVESSLELFNTSEVTNQCILQLAISQFASPLAGRGKILPKQRVVDVSTPIELKSGLQGNRLSGGKAFRVRSFSSVQSVDISLVVFGVMKSHDLLRDMRLQSIVSVGQFGQSVNCPSNRCDKTPGVGGGSESSTGNGQQHDS